MLKPCLSEGVILSAPNETEMDKAWRNLRFIRGFTLIELLLVISLMGLVTSLVAPKLFSAYQKILVQSEEKEISSLLNAISYRAFIQYRSIEVKLDENTLSVAGKPFLKLKYVRFPETVLTFIQSGFCKQNRIYYQLGNETRFIPVSTL